MSAAVASVAVIVVAAGSGTRLGLGTPKAFVAFRGATVLEHALAGIARVQQPLHVVVAAPVSHVEAAERMIAGAHLSGSAVAGGASRAESVQRALAAVPTEIDTVLVHDAARPLQPAVVFDRVIAQVRASGDGVVPALAVTDTMKRVDGDTVVEALDRSTLRAMQTPQGFPAAMLRDANARVGGDHTDDAAVVQAAGYRVRVVDGDELGNKITTQADLALADCTQPDSSSADAAGIDLRVGVGTDAHAYGDGRALRLACLEWPGENGLSGHSDGDVVAHAIVDALLSAAGLGDIGGMFGTDDERYDGAAGSVFLSGAVEALRVAGFTPVNVAVQLIGNRPKFAPRRAEAESVLTGLVGAPVSVSATTSDAMGFTGRGEGIAAVANALVRRTR